MKGLRLIATGGALPGRTVTNEELSRTVDTSDEWITTRTGIRTRHYCTEGENAATLAIAAAKQALQRSGLAPADIACCVCATLSAPDATPSVACQVQAALGTDDQRLQQRRSAQCQQKRQQPYQRVAQYQPARSRHSRPPEQTQYLFPPPLHRRTSLSQNFYKIFLVFFALP